MCSVSSNLRGAQLGTGDWRLKTTKLKEEREVERQQESVEMGAQEEAEILSMLRMACLPPAVCNTSATEVCIEGPKSYLKLEVSKQ